MGFDAGAVATGVAREALGVLGAGAGLAADGAAELIRTGGPPSILPKVGIGVARQACRRYADNPGSVPGPAAAGFDRVCRPYLDDIGYGTPPTLGKPFEGGQCAGTYYTATVRFYNISTGAVSGVATFEGFGPVAVRPGGNQQPSPGGTPPPGQSYQPGRELTFNGVPRVSWDGGYGVRSGAEVLSVVPRGDEPNNCGDPQPDVRGPVPPPNPGPVREPFNPSPDIDIDIDVTIGPGGDVTFNIGTGPITIDPFGGDDDGGEEPGGGGGPDNPPGDIGAPAAPVPTGPDGRANGCAPPNSVLVGVKVNIVSSPPFGSEYDPAVRRGACYVYMGTLGNLALETSGVALRSGQMFFAPLDNLTCWEVNANTGYVLQVVPYYRALEPEEV